MEYEAPKLIELGSVKDLTLGQLLPGPSADNTVYFWAKWDILGDPGSR